MCCCRAINTCFIDGSEKISQDVSDLHLKMSSNDPWRKKSKGNSEREREQSRSIDPLPSGGRRHRTTYSVSRTGNTPKAEQAALERLKTRLTYDDEVSCSLGITHSPYLDRVSCTLFYKLQDGRLMIS